MPLIILDKLELAYGHWPLLDQASLVIDKGERIGLIGRNGTGKSSLLRIVAGLDRPDAGEVWRSPGLRLGHVPQEPVYVPGHTVFEAVAEGLGEARRLLTAYHEAAHQVALDPRAERLAELDPLPASTARGGRPQRPRGGHRGGTPGLADALGGAGGEGEGLDRGGRRLTRSLPVKPAPSYASG